MVDNLRILRGIVYLMLAALLAGCAVPTPEPYNPLPTRTPAPPRVLPTDSALFPTLAIPSTGQAAATLPNPLIATPSTYLNLSPTLTARAKAQPTPTPLAHNQPASAAPKQNKPLSPPTPAPTRPPLPPSALVGLNWALVPSSAGLWAMHPDGSGAHLLVNDPILHMAASPGGTIVAYLTHADPNNMPDANPYGYALKILTLYNGRSYTITQINPPARAPAATPSQLDQAYQTVLAYDHNGLAWSPDGRTLAFTSGMDGPASNVYLYSPSSATIRRLTDLAAWAGNAPGDASGSYSPHAYGLDWSPDGSRLFVDAAYSFGGGDAFLMAGAWLVDRAGASSRVADGSYSGENLIAWVGSANLLLSSYQPDCGDLNLRTFTLSSQGSIALMGDCYADLAYDRVRQEVLLSVTEAQAAPNHAAGLYLGQVTRGLQQISNQSFTKLIKGDGNTPWFGFNNTDGLFAIQRGGQVQPLFTGAGYTQTSNNLRPSMRWPDPRTWLFTADDGLYLARPGQPPAQLFDQKPQGLWLAPGGTRLLFTAYQDGKLRLFSVSANDFTPKAMDSPIEEPSGVIWP